MKPLYTQYSGAQAVQWSTFAKKKLKQLKERLEAVGLTTGRQLLHFGSVKINLFTTQWWDRIRIETSGATFFSLYRYMDGSLNVYHSLAAFNDDGDRQWVIHFDSHPLLSLLQRGLIGCSSDGNRVIMTEVDPDTELRVFTVTDGSIDAGEAFDLTSIACELASNPTGKVSVGGSRAVIGTGEIMLTPSEIDKHVAFVYDAALTPKITAITINAEIDRPVVFGGSSDLSVVFLATQHYTADPPATTFAIPYTKAVITDTVTVTDETISVTAPDVSYFSVNNVTCSYDGEVNAPYVTLSDVTGTDIGNVVCAIKSSGTLDVTLSTDTEQSTASLVNVSTNVITQWGVQNLSEAFVYAISNALTPSSVGPVSGTYISPSLATVATTEAVVALSPDREYRVIQTSTKYIVRGPEGDFDLPSDTHASAIGTFSAHAILEDAQVVYSVLEPGVQGGATSYRKWVALRDEDGVLTGYDDPVTIGSMPSTISRTEGVSTLTLSRTGTTVSVYPQLVL